MVHRAKCCNPIPGDEIVGYVTRGRGVAVHSTACPNVRNLLYESERRIAVEWASAAQAAFPVRLRIRSEDRPGILAEITGAISDAAANIRHLESSSESLHALILVALDVADRKQLERILANIKKIPGIFEIKRVYNAAEPSDS
jgi:guanosine-3',5'-bis(diphosphate) 3'-pyrophosphohydrolase